MRLLLDTCVFLWFVCGEDRLNAKVLAALKNADNDLFVSALSIAEIGIKNSLLSTRHKIPVIKLLEKSRSSLEIVSLPLSDFEALEMNRLPSIHKDPFDRLLICQALHHDLTLVTPDEKIHRYPVSYLW